MTYETVGKLIEACARLEQALRDAGAEGTGLKELIDSCPSLNGKDAVKNYLKTINHVRNQIVHDNSNGYDDRIINKYINYLDKIVSDLNRPSGKVYDSDSYVEVEPEERDPFPTPENHSTPDDSQRTGKVYYGEVIEPSQVPVDYSSCPPIPRDGSNRTVHEALRKFWLIWVIAVVLTVVLHSIPFFFWSGLLVVFFLTAAILLPAVSCGTRCKISLIVWGLLFIPACGIKMYDDSMREKVEIFKSQTFQNEADALDKYKVFYTANKDNPYLEEAEEYVFDYVEMRIEERLKNFNDSDVNSYSALETLAEKIQNSESRKLKRSWVGEFAEAFDNMMDSPHEVTITQIGGKAKVPVYIKKVYWRKNYGDLASYGEPNVSTAMATFQGWRDLIPEVFYAETIKCHPWEVVSIECDLRQHERGWDTDLDNISIDIFPGRYKGKEGFGDNCLYEHYVDISIFYAKNYKNIYDILCDLGKSDLIKK